MKKRYKIFLIKNEEVCVPSTSYYARGNDWQTESLNLLTPQDLIFDSYEEAENSIMEYNYPNDNQYIILPVYSMK